MEGSLACASGLVFFGPPLAEFRVQRHTVYSDCHCEGVPLALPVPEGPEAPPLVLEEDEQRIGRTGAPSTGGASGTRAWHG